MLSFLSPSLLTSQVYKVKWPYDYKKYIFMKTKQKFDIHKKNIHFAPLISCFEVIPTQIMLLSTHLQEVECYTWIVLRVTGRPLSTHESKQIDEHPPGQFQVKCSRKKVNLKKFFLLSKMQKSIGHFNNEVILF